MNKKISIKTIVIILLICINIGFLLFVVKMKNKKIEGQDIIKEQLEEAIIDNVYITLEDHNSELKEKQQEINNIENIAGQSTITEDKILKGYTAYKDGKLITGTMENRGELNWNPSTSTSYTVPAGYYSGGTISTTNAIPTKTQTLSASYTFSQYEGYTFNFTCSELTKVVGITSMTNSYPNELAPRSMTISGNVVSVSVFNTSKGTHSTTITITAIGY